MMTKEIKVKNCPLCGFSTFKFLYVAYDRMLGLPGKFSVKQCSSCSLVFLDPRPTRESLKKYYPSKKYYAYTSSTKKGLFGILREYLVTHYYHPNLFSLFISTFIQNVPAMPSYVKNGNILDIGCGAGDTLVLLKNVGWDTYGLDMDEWALKNAKKRGLKNLRLGTYEALAKYPDNFFDAIRLYHVIEHIDDAVVCLRLIRQKLKKNGELVVGAPNVDSIVSRLFRSYWYNLDIPRHVILFSPKTLTKLAKKEGFSVQKIEYCSAGGIIGSIQYVLSSLLNTKIDLIHILFFVLLFYPFDWLLNKIGNGDVFVMRAKGGERA